MEDDLPVFKIASMHQYNEDSKITLKNADEDWSQCPEIIQTTEASIEQKLTENKNVKKNNCMDISSN